MNDSAKISCTRVSFWLARTKFLMFQDCDHWFHLIRSIGNAAAESWARVSLRIPTICWVDGFSTAGERRTLSPSGRAPCWTDSASTRPYSWSSTTASIASTASSSLRTRGSRTCRSSLRKWVSRKRRRTARRKQSQRQEVAHVWGWAVDEV